MPLLPFIHSKVSHLVVTNCHAAPLLILPLGSGDVAGEAFKDYSGLFYLRKLPRLNSLVWGHSPEALTFLFQMRYVLSRHGVRILTFPIHVRRRTFKIEEIHLPPEIDRSGATGDKPTPAKVKGKVLALSCYGCDSYRSLMKASSGALPLCAPSPKQDSPLDF